MSQVPAYPGAAALHAVVTPKGGCIERTHS